MANLCQIIWTVVVTIAVSVGRIPALEDNNFRFTLPEDDKFRSASLIPAKIRMSDAVYDRLLVHLSDQLSAEGVDIPINDYFPREVESDEEDELEFVKKYDFDEDEDDNVDEFITNLPKDGSISTNFGKHEFTFAKVLEIRKNGTKTFSKVRQSAKISGSATTSATGSNTNLDVTTSASGKFDVNSTYFSKGKHQNVLVSGTAVTSSSSKFKVEKRRVFQEASADSSITLQNPSLVQVNSSVRSGSETFKLPLRSYLTYFKGQANIWKIKSSLEGHVISRVVFANKTVSFTKSSVNAYVKSKSIDNNTKVDAVAPPNLLKGSLIRAKTHTWTKVVSQSKTEVVVDVITCTKTRIYGSVRREYVIFIGAGQVSWEKSRITIVAKRLHNQVHNLSPHQYGIYFIEKRLQSSSFIQFLGSPFEIL